VKGPQESIAQAVMTEIGIFVFVANSGEFLGHMPLKSKRINWNNAMVLMKML